MKKPQIEHFETTINGRYILQIPSGKTPIPLLIGFHGYGETAEKQLEMMNQIPGINSWFCGSIQALHPFYNAKGELGASWMTSQDRELRIKENVHYVNSVISKIKETYPANDILVYHGFSQGTAMACRAAILGDHEPAGVILLGGDIPPELNSLDKMRKILIARGKKDRFYNQEKWRADIDRINQLNLDYKLCEFDGGHHGNDEYFKTAGEFLKRITEDNS